MMKLVVSLLALAACTTQTPADPRTFVAGTWERHAGADSERLTLFADGTFNDTEVRWDGPHTVRGTYSSTENNLHFDLASSTDLLFTHTVDFSYYADPAVLVRGVFLDLRHTSSPSDRFRDFTAWDSDATPVATLQYDPMTYVVFLNHLAGGQNAFVGDCVETADAVQLDGLTFEPLGDGAIGHRGAPIGMLGDIYAFGDPLALSSIFDRVPDLR